MQTPKSQAWCPQKAAVQSISEDTKNETKAFLAEDIGSAQQLPIPLPLIHEASSKIFHTRENHREAGSILSYAFHQGLVFVGRDPCQIAKQPMENLDLHL